MGQGAMQQKQPLDVDAIFPQIAEISDPGLADAVRAVWAELWEAGNWPDFEAMPTSPEIPYPARPHSQCVVDLALTVADTLARHHGIAFNRDHLIAAAVLQDASKVVEYRPDAEGRAELTETGRLYPHAFLAAEAARRHGMPDAIVHAILLHTPQAASFPKTFEGKVLYHVDQLDVIAIYKDRWRKEIFITK